MSDTIKIICDNLGGELEVPMGTTLQKIAERLTPGKYPFLAAFVNNRIKELNYRIYTPVTIRFVDITSFEGIRVYQRTAWFILQKAVRDLYPDRTLHIRHSLGQSGVYCEIEGIDEFSREETDALKARMREIVASDLPIERRKALTSEVRARYAAEGFADKRNVVAAMRDKFLRRKPSALYVVCRYVIDVGQFRATTEHHHRHAVQFHSAFQFVGGFKETDYRADARRNRRKVNVAVYD